MPEKNLYQRLAQEAQSALDDLYNEAVALGLSERIASDFAHTINNKITTLQLSAEELMHEKEELEQKVVKLEDKLNVKKYLRP